MNYFLKNPELAAFIVEPVAENIFPAFKRKKVGPRLVELTPAFELGSNVVVGKDGKFETRLSYSKEELEGINGHISKTGITSLLPTLLKKAGGMKISVDQEAWGFKDEDLWCNRFGRNALSNAELKKSVSDGVWLTKEGQYVAIRDGNVIHSLQGFTFTSLKWAMVAWHNGYRLSVDRLKEAWDYIIPNITFRVRRPHSAGQGLVPELGSYQMSEVGYPKRVNVYDWSYLLPSSVSIKGDLEDLEPKNFYLNFEFLAYPGLGKTYTQELNPGN
jgi:hypothetical protein